MSPMSVARAALSQRPKGCAPSPSRSTLSHRADKSDRGDGDARPLASVVGCPYWPASYIAGQLITASRGAKETNLSPCRGNLQRTQGRLRRVAHVALNRCIWREKRPGSADCPTCITFECRSCEISHIEEGGPARWRDTDLFRLFRKQARECRRLATLAQDSDDRSFWLRLADHWLRLSQDADRRAG